MLSLELTPQIFELLPTEISFNLPEILVQELPERR